MTAMMKEKLNIRLGDEVVKEIVLKAGRVSLPAPEEPEKIHAILPLTFRQQALIENESASITDPETRRAFIELMQACLERDPGTK